MTFSPAKCLAVLLLVCAPALSACQTDGPSAQATAEEAAAKGPTRQEAALQCWSAVDKAHPTMGLDQRADLVTKCIDDKMNGPHPPAPPAKPKT